MYPIEIHLASELASGKRVEGVTWDDVAEINAKHAREHAGVGKLDQHFRQVQDDVAQVVTSATKINKRGDRIVALEFENDLPPGSGDILPSPLTGASRAAE